MSEIDWSKAPDGATHYRPQFGYWYKQDVHAWVWIDSGWARMDRDDLGEYSFSCNLIELPSLFEWNGTGLPPVGTVCECQNNEMKWLQGTIVYVGKDNGTPLAIMQTKTEILYGEAGEFRPIRTPEQIAAEEREKAIDGMFNEANERAFMSYRELCAALYDAGYRKTEEPKP